MAPSSRRALACLVCSVALLGASSCTPWVWVAFDASEPGTPAELSLDEAESSASQTTLELRVHGFWWRWLPGDDGERYRQIDSPGLVRGDVPGQPDLPSLRSTVAIPTDAGAVTVGVDELESVTLPDYLVMPTQIPAGDHAPGTLPHFVIDPAVYTSPLPWPVDAVSISAIQKRFRQVPSAEGRFHVFRWTPSVGDLHVSTHVRYVLSHPGTPQSFDPMTRERELLSSHTFLNWDVVAPLIPTDFSAYHAEYLFLYPSAAYADEIEPLVIQKRARGFLVTERTVDSIVAAGASCGDIRGAIQDWLSGVPDYRDAYALLVGDTSVIPLCDAPGGLLDNVGNPVVTDDLYASPAGDDLVEEVFLGRLSVDDEADAAAQVAKILAYEDAPSPFCCYDRAILWSAGKELGSHAYATVHDLVQSLSLAVAPSFVSLTGIGVSAILAGDPGGGALNADVVAAVNTGAGVVSYRGHGVPWATATRWDELNEDFDAAWVQSLANPVERSPVVWGVACSNAAIFAEDSIAEVWMEQPASGSVSYYGATSPSWTKTNDKLTEWLFRAVYDEGLITQSHAIARAESQVVALDGAFGVENAWRYLLLGDPDLQIRRENPIDLQVLLPFELQVCELPPCFLDVQVLDEVGTPVEEAFVGLWKGGAAGDEVFSNGYTDASGSVTLAADPLTPGPLYYAVEDGRGNSVFAQLPVTAP